MTTFLYSISLGIPAGCIILIIGTMMGTIVVPDYIDSSQLAILGWIVSAYYIQGIIFAFFYCQFERYLDGSPIVKGITFGFILWIVSSFPVMLKMFLYYQRLDVLFQFIEQGFFRRTLITDLISYPLVGMMLSIFVKRYFRH